MPPDLDTEEHQNEFLKLLLLLALRAERRAERFFNPELRSALNNVLYLLDDLPDTGFSRQIQWQQMQPVMFEALGDLEDVMSEKMPEIMEEQAGRASSAAANVMRIAAATTLLLPINREQVRDQARRTARRIADDIDRKVRSGILKDDSTQKIQDDIGRRVSKNGRQSVYTIKGTTSNLARSRMKNFVAGEVWKATSDATTQTWSELTEVVYVWNAILDPVTCPICRPLHQTIVQKPQSFVSVLNEVSPYSRTSPPVHPNCRCCIMPRRIPRRS